MNPESSVDGWGAGSIKLKTAYGNFSLATLTGYPAWADSLAAGDFNEDGWPDLIVSSSQYANVLAFAQNKGPQGQLRTFEITAWLDGSTGSGGIPTAGFGNSSIDPSSFVALTSGDYDGDGDLDLFYVSCVRETMTIERLYLYENTGSLNFTRHDVTTAWTASPKSLSGIGRTAPCLASLDYDKDGDIDILYGDRYGKIFALKNTGSGAWGGRLSFSIIAIRWSKRLGPRPGFKGWPSRMSNTTAITISLSEAEPPTSFASTAITEWTLSPPKPWRLSPPPESREERTSSSAPISTKTGISASSPA